MVNSEYKEEIFMTEEKQIIEVEYNEKLVEEFRNNYIMEEEGIGADEIGEVYGTQTEVNEVPITEMIEDGEVVIDDKND